MSTMGHNGNVPATTAAMVRMRLRGFAEVQRARTENDHAGKRHNSQRRNARTNSFCWRIVRETSPVLRN